MNILIIGGGAREHALAATFAKEDATIWVAPGNAGIAKEFQCLPLSGNSDILNWCREHRPDLVVVGPEQPLAEGLADLLDAAGIACLGPSQAAARIESSKVFAKELMAGLGIPTAAYNTFPNPEQALQWLRFNNGFPVVIKADPLAAGKGVFVVHDEEQARNAMQSITTQLGKECPVLVEEYLQGWEVSLFAITDGLAFCTTPFVQDYKQLGDGDTGPNTGGMGAVCPIWEAEVHRKRISHEIIGPMLKALRDQGCPFRGFLYCGLMITPRGPKVLEFNCRLGDPEAQVLLPLLTTPLTTICAAVLQGGVEDLKIEWNQQHSVCVVLASHGYPGDYAVGHPIQVGDDVSSRVFYGGVAQHNGQLSTQGGRVLSLVSLATDLPTARWQVYSDTALINFEGKTMRKDIGLRANQT